MIEDSLTIEFSEGITRCGDSGPANKTELGITGRLELSLAFLSDLFDITHGDESVEAILVINHKQLVDSQMLREELVSNGDRIFAEFLPSDGVNLRARG